MLQTDYDPNQTVYNAGGIVAYVAGQAYSLPTAASNVLGGVKVGTNLSIDGSGVLSATDTTYSDATTSASGLMSASDKTKLNGIATGAEVNIQANWNETDTDSDAYIQNKPSIPAAQIQSTNSSLSFNVPIWHAVSGTTQEFVISTSDTSKTFTGLNANYGYKPFIQTADGTSMAYTDMTFDNTNLTCTITFDSPSAAQAAGNLCKIKLLEIR